MAIGAVLLAYGSIQLDEFIRNTTQSRPGWVYAGGPAGARAVLAAIAGSIVTVAATTFSITIAALSLASSQFGPRLLRAFRRDTGNQIVLGTFISTFLYCLLVLRTVQGTEKNTYVPHVSVTLGVALAILSLGVLIYFIHHTAGSIQVSHVMDSVEKELLATLATNLVEKENHEKNEFHSCVPSSLPTSCSPVIAPARTGGYLLRVDYEALAAFAAQNQLTVRLTWRPGEFLVAGMPLVSLWSRAGVDSDSLKAIYTSFYFGSERSPEQDPEFAFLQLAEIAVRALSPGINDPFTAMSCVDRLTAGLCLAGERRIPSADRYDSEGNLRLSASRVTYLQLVRAAFLHIRRASRDSVTLLEHLRDRISLVLSRTDNQELRRALEDEDALTIADLARATQTTGEQFPPDCAHA